MCRKLCQNSVSGSGSLDLFDRNEPSVSVRTVIGIQPQVGDPPNHLVGGFKHLDYCPFHIWDVILPIDELIFFKMVIAPPTSHVWAQGLLTIYDWGRGSLNCHARDGRPRGESWGELQSYSYHTWADANIVHVLWKYLHNAFHFYPKCCWFAGFCVHHLVMIHVPILVTPLMGFSGRLPLDPSKFTIPLRNPSCSSHLGAPNFTPSASQEIFWFQRGGPNRGPLNAGKTRENAVVCQCLSCVSSLRQTP